MTRNLLIAFSAGVITGLILSLIPVRPDTSDLMIEEYRDSVKVLKKEAVAYQLIAEEAMHQTEKYSILLDGLKVELDATKKQNKDYLKRLADEAKDMPTSALQDSIINFYELNLNKD